MAGQTDCRESEGTAGYGKENRQGRWPASRRKRSGSIHRRESLSRSRPRDGWRYHTAALQKRPRGRALNGQACPLVRYDLTEMCAADQSMVNQRLAPLDSVPPLSSLSQMLSEIDPLRLPSLITLRDSPFPEGFEGDIGAGEVPLPASRQASSIRQNRSVAGAV